jgi:hypothetical protein
MPTTFPNYRLLSLEQRQLWTRIEAFSLDDIVPRLLRENAWTMPYLDRVLLEFKKYAFLCVISPQPLSPSKTVDIVWHTFLLYTRLYWEDFCPNILTRSLHHTPSRGGFEEKKKYQDMYCHTLNYYQQILGEQPPLDIWETPKPKKNIRPLLRLIFDSD